ncbi:hypothetical protein HS088_TW12G00217 [Tripterygium wilfordii]|uniref:Uncharacterized protein n=1 Tax=Tripterygium wilfordii TaxID=458696 RepID=A0A7J7CY47_TRIWF|nr:hypothetical protein HS088_TW12G00217 [Tripterygium wilfordii]
MGGEAKPSQDSSSGGGFKSRMVYYINSGEKKHVFAGVAIISAVFGIPWYLMTRDDGTFTNLTYEECGTVVEYDIPYCPLSLYSRRLLGMFGIIGKLCALNLSLYSDGAIYGCHNEALTSIGVFDVGEFC